MHLQNDFLMFTFNNFCNNKFKFSIFKSSKVEILNTFQKNTIFKIFIKNLIECAKIIKHQIFIKSIYRKRNSIKQMSMTKLDFCFCTSILLIFISFENDSTLIFEFFIKYIEFEFLFLLLQINLISQMKKTA